MKNLRKTIIAALFLCLTAALLSGCMCTVIETTVRPDGSGVLTTRAGLTKEALDELDQAMEPSDSETPKKRDPFTYDGKEYYGTVATSEFANPAELNELLKAPAADPATGKTAEDAGVQPEGNVTLARNDDGSFTLIYKGTPPEDKSAESADVPELSEEQVEELKSQMVMVYEFTMPGAVTQVSGPKEGVTVDGAKLKLDLVKMESKTATTWEFRSAPPTGGEAVKLAVVPTRQRLTVNGVEKNAEIYNINGSNYFKLRDIAALLGETGSRFSVDFDAAKNTIVVQKGGSYAAGELKVPDEATMLERAKTAVRSPQSIQIDGAAADLTAYNINNTNYFGLRALGKALDFNVDYDQATATMIVTTR